MPDGKIEPLQVERLKEMGNWLNQYGFSVYGTRGGPFKPTDWGVSTRKGNTIYLHILKWNGDSVNIQVPDFGMQIKNCRLTNGGDIEFEKGEQGTFIRFNVDKLQPISTIIEIEVDGSVMDIPPMEIGTQSERR